MRIIFVSNTNEIKRPYIDQSVRYRCFHPAEDLRRIGVKTVVTTLAAFVQNPNFNYDAYIFHRPTFSPNAARIINTLRRQRKVLVADYDDLVVGEKNVECSYLYKKSHLGYRSVKRLFANNLRALEIHALATPYAGVVSIIIECQRLEKITAAIVELNLSNLIDVFVDPADLASVARVVIARGALDNICLLPIKFFFAKIFVVILIEFERSEILKRKL